MEPENKPQKESDEKPEKKKKKSSFSDKLSYVLGGKVLTEDFFVRQSKLLFLIFCLIIIFISNRYSCAKKLSEIDQLQKELSDLKNEQNNLTYKLSSTSRQANIGKLLHEKGIELTNENTTVYSIKN